MTEQVEGQIKVSDEYPGWDAPALGQPEIKYGDMGDPDGHEMGEHDFGSVTYPNKEVDLVAKAKEVFEDVVVTEMPEEVEAEERGLVTVAPQPRADHHIVTGMAALARMSPDEYEQAITVVQQGLARVKDFMQRAMTKGEDYGTVKGIDRPFLHLPGAEKLCLLYGLAARQEAERIDGKIDPATGLWTSPPIAYHVKTYIHLGDFDGPIVAMGYGEANSWEIKYRYSWAKATCPACSREGLIKGKEDGKLKGKWWCPGWQGGCNQTFEPNDPKVLPPGKVENKDPHSLAETLIQMAAKRSFVAGTRRATGTSGLFTQDEDSPSVQAQADPDDRSDDDVKVEAVNVDVARGGKAENPTTTQIALMGQISKEKDLGPDALAAVIQRVTDLDAALPADGDRGTKGRALLAFINGHLSGDQMGAVLLALQTGEIPNAS